MKEFKSERHQALSRQWPSEPRHPRITYRPKPIPTRRSLAARIWQDARSYLAAGALLAVFAAIGVLLAWRV